MRVALVITLAIALLGCSAPSPEHFPGYTWQDLGDGIYVHSRTDPFAGPVDGNSTVIVNDEDVFVVDTHINPAAARAVIAKIREITDKPVSHVVNTHWHDDHVNGNHAYKQAFPEARFVAHEATAAALEEKWAAFEDQRRAVYERLAGQDLLAAADSIEATSVERAMGVRIFAGYRDALESELPTMELVYPDLLFDDQMIFERGERTIVVQWMGRANTDGDAMVWLPKEKVLITGDVLVEPVPYAFDSPMVDWVETLRRIQVLEPATIVPGHGAVQRDEAYLEQVITLLGATIDAVASARTADVAYADLLESVDLEAQEQLFTGGDPARAYAWRAYYLGPGLNSAWSSLGFPLPDTE